MLHARKQYFRLGAEITSQGETKEEECTRERRRNTWPAFGFKKGWTKKEWRCEESIFAGHEEVGKCEEDGSKGEGKSVWLKVGCWEPRGRLGRK